MGAAKCCSSVTYWGPEGCYEQQAVRITSLDLVKPRVEFQKTQMEIKLLHIVFDTTSNRSTRVRGRF